MTALQEAAAPDTAPAATARKRLDKAWYEASDGYGAAAVGLHVLPIFALLLTAAPLWQWAGPAVAALLVLPLGVLIYRLTIVLHDCAHMTLFRTRKWNRICGRFVGFMLGSEFDEFTRLHFLHHKAYGAPIDPQGRDYLGLRAASRGRILWHLIRPLFGWNLFKLKSFTPDQDVAPGSPRPRRKDGAMVRFVAGTLAVQVLIAAAATLGGTVWWTVLLYPAAAATVALFLSQLRGFCEHVVPAGADEEAFVRTHLPNLFDRTFFYALNFNYHVEHHLYPAVPSRLLPRLCETVAKPFHRPDTISTSIIRTVRQRLSQCPN